MSGIVRKIRDALTRRDSVVGINRRNVELVYALNPRRFYPMADDKLLTKSLLEKAGVAVPETIAVVRGLFEVPQTVTNLEGESEFVVKPSNGSGGGGILVIGDALGGGRWGRAGGRELDRETLARHLADIVFGVHSGMMEDQAFVERRVVPHQVFDELWADGLCDVRVLSLKGVPLLSMVRVPTSRSGGRANLHQGGLGLAVSLETGRTFRAVSMGTTLERHPESGSALLGIQLPFWAEILETARRAALAVPLGYLGIDVVVDRSRGPLILEINARPGLEIQNVNGRGLGEELARISA